MNQRQRREYFTKVLDRLNPDPIGDQIDLLSTLIYNEVWDGNITLDDALLKVITRVRSMIICSSSDSTVMQDLQTASSVLNKTLSALEKSSVGVTNGTKRSSK